MTNEEIMAAALSEIMDEEFAQLEKQSKEKKHRFSVFYKLRKKSITRIAKRSEKEASDASRRRYVPLRRLALVTAIVGAAVVLSIGAYAVVRLIFSGFVLDNRTTYTDLTIDPSQYDMKENIEEVYWIPLKDNMEIYAELADKWAVMYEYIIDKDKHVVLSQFSGELIEQSLRLNTEDAEIRPIRIKGNDGFIIIRRLLIGTYEKSVVWLMDGYVFEITSNDFSEEEVISLAEKVTIRENYEIIL